jgi:hypothetical protein
MIEIRHKKAGDVLLRVDAETLEKADLTDAWLPGADLRGANLHQSKLTGATLDRADLTGADLRATLHGVKMAWADLRGANLEYASGPAADLRGASLRNVKALRADFRKADLRQADLCGGVFYEAWFSKADLRGSRFDEHTVWSPGFQPERHGAVRVGDGAAIVDQVMGSKLQIIGGWLLKDGRMEGDQATHIIDHLIADHLIEVDGREGGWTKLYLDPSAGTYWELTYPRSEMHGGGPRILTQLSADAVRSQYGREIG